MNSIHFCLVLHNHQPVGNFDGVFEQAYQDSYLPFLEVFEQFPDLKISLHTSGPLVEWLDKNHPDYIDRLAALAALGRLEIVGGAFYEPILTMIPSRDRIGQIQTYRGWLENRLETEVRGLWLPERVWEQSLTRDLVDAGVQYTVLDDFHFRNAGLTDEELDGPFLTEDDGRILRVFPGSERLRYLIPFADPQQTIDYLRQVAERRPGAVAVFGDDGEKFGTWPETKQHVYEYGWLRQFFQLLTDHQSWIKTSTLSEAVAHSSPRGRIYLPDASYREMTEWVLPPERHNEYDELVHSLEHDERWDKLRRYVRGGYWRNFKVRYDEANEMYCRMMLVSQRLEEIEREGAATVAVQRAARALYRGQCNCSYWHGAFGGLYLPHLRNAVYSQLIEADNLLDESQGRDEPWVEATVGDYNFDSRQEVRLSNDKLICLISPGGGGHLYELDVRTIRLNLLATLARREEAYHRQVLAGAGGGSDDVKSIHNRVVFKQEGLEQRLQYDSAPRKSLVDHFFPADTTLDDVVSGRVEELGNFAQGDFETKLRRDSGRIQVQMRRAGRAGGRELTVTKAVTLNAGARSLEIAYLLEGLQPGEPQHFAVELNFAGLPAGADDRFFHQDGSRLGQLGELLDLQQCRQIGLTDQWLGIDVRLELDRPSDLWTFPIQTVSQSEGGFELVHQSVVVLPHWRIQGDAQGRWAVKMSLELDTQLAESRHRQQAAEAIR